MAQPQPPPSATRSEFQDEDDQPNYVPGLGVLDPFGKPKGAVRSLVHGLLATALFRCWHILLFFTAWAAAVALINHAGFKANIEPTLLTVLGTVLGFVISYRTTSSFERYNEGRKLWSQIVLATRTFARTIWFHVANTAEANVPAEEAQARVLFEKKTVINLLEAFSVAVKHYLRGEDGIHYVDLYHLVKFLPAYALPAGYPSTANFAEQSHAHTTAHAHGHSLEHDTKQRHPHVNVHGPANGNGAESEKEKEAMDLNHDGLSPRSLLSIPEELEKQDAADAKALEAGLPRPNAPPALTLRPVTSRASLGSLPMPNTTPRRTRVSSATQAPLSAGGLPPSSRSLRSHPGAGRASGLGPQRPSTGPDDEGILMPARNPPKYSLFDLFPFSLLVRALTKRGKDVSGKKAARLRAKRRGREVTHNIPLEISLYLSSYVAALQQRKILDPPTNTILLAQITLLVDALTGLERILTTPIPFSYSAHLWAVTFIYCLVLPFQVWTALGWITIPGTAIVSFIFFGFLVAGEEIENPFGYDKNDLNMDHFTHNIIRNELRAVTATPAPELRVWAFANANDCAFAADEGERGTPEEWIKRGAAKMRAALVY